jgi:hypothetical protein
VFRNKHGTVWIAAPEASATRSLRMRHHVHATELRLSTIGPCTSAMSLSGLRESAPGSPAYEAAF